MSTPPYHSITAVVAALYCEKQVVFDHLRGRARSVEIEARATLGRAEHKRFENDGRRQMASADRRCFIATAIYGGDAPQTELLRQWRDKVLMPSRAGRTFVRCYYALSPAFVAPLERFALARIPVRATLNLVIRLLGGRP